MTGADSMTVAAEPMLPLPYRVTSRTAETRDSITLRLETPASRCRRSGPASSRCWTSPASGRYRSL